jgi:para-nitrobenzyl esterase
MNIMKKKWNLLIFTILIVVVLMAGGVAAAATVPTVSKTSKYTKGIVQNTIYGKVRGYKANKAKTLIWKGIPYAKAPVGALRWKAPRNPDKWDGILNATKNGNITIQFKKSSGKIIGSEDCLNLDIYRPNSAAINLPILVYIHGGNNQTGTSAINVQQFVVNAQAIVVSINHRMNLLGFNNLPALRRGNAYEASGNYALLDISKSLDWVKKNIAYFGGNPQNITVSGGSAGGRNVVAMLVSPIFAGKFEKALSFSGGMTIADYNASAKLIAKAIAPLVVEDNVKETKEEAYRWLLTADKKVTDYLYGLSADRLVKLMIPTGYRKQKMGNAWIRMADFPHLYADGIVLPKEGFNTKKFNNVPLMLVTGSSELSMFVRSEPEFAFIKDEDLLSNAELYKSYRFAVDYGSKLYGYANTQEVAEKIVGKYNAPIYTCDFDWGSDPKIVGEKMAKLHGSFHCIALSFLKNEPGSRIPSDVFQTAGAQDLATKFQKYIANFLWTGNPNSKGLVEWEPWRDANIGPTQLLLNADKEKAIITMSSERIKYEDVLKEMEADTSVSKEVKDNLIENVLNGRWFSGGLDKYFGNLNLWVGVD